MIWQDLWAFFLSGIDRSRVARVRFALGVVDDGRPVCGDILDLEVGQEGEKASFPFLVGRKSECTLELAAFEAGQLALSLGWLDACSAVVPVRAGL